MFQGIESSLETRYREDLRNVCHLAYSRGLVSGTEGNFSLKLNDNLVLITPQKSNKGLIKESDFVIVDLEGNVISNSGKVPTTELYLHLEAYKKRKDVKAVVHAHPILTVSFSVAGKYFTQPVIPEIIVLLGEIPTIPYGEPGTTQLAKVVSTYLEKNDAVILEKHGAVTVGKDILDAYLKMESLEHSAKIVHSASLLGEIKTLDEKDVRDLIEQRHKIFGKEVELREGKNLFKGQEQAFTIKKLLKKVFEGNAPVFQRVLSLANDVFLASLERTSYSQKLTYEEKERLAKELTSAFLSVILGRFIKK
jgi:L-fuculose-phosphate aldolase